MLSRSLKKAISNAVALHHIDYSKPIHLEVDASTLGLGGILFQKIDGKIRPIRNISGKRYSRKLLLYFIALQSVITIS